MIPPRCELVLKDVALPDGRVADLSISDGLVVHTGSPCQSDQIISCRGLTVLPGAVDMHVHMRGGIQQEKEDWKRFDNSLSNREPSGAYSSGANGWRCSRVV